ncbi:MAG: hypothetical protein C5B52_19055 [Bacteroidetes bacterium]|nr:MAG: hypothetical protein C5B52_19055 [Bacteroidota bacterium]
MSRRIILNIIEFFTIFILACVPLFITFPYRVNIFLSWEGAYRMSQGQIPFRDFGTPMGGMYWVVPAIFFKIFGPQMFTLIKAQVFINVISGLAFRSILKSLNVHPGIRVTGVILYCLSFSFFNFWPWYNHSVIVYEFVAIAFLLKGITGSRTYLWLALAGIFTFISFFTKQDGGGMCLLICTALLIYDNWQQKRWMPLGIYFGSFILVFLAVVIPLSNYSFGYWFNHGQPPHNSRFSLSDAADEFFGNSQWLKFYIFLVVLIIAATFKNFKEFIRDRQQIIFLLLTLGILTEAAIFQITSYTPPDNNIFFHSFAFVFIMTWLSYFLKLDFNKWKIIITCMAGVMLWWSGVYWTYIVRIAARGSDSEGLSVSPTGENVVSRHNYIFDLDTTKIPQSKWIFSDQPLFRKIYMPAPTVEGMDRILNMDLVKNNKNLKVLNMSELTPLAAEIPFQLERNPNFPLWYHLGVGMFNREATMFENRIRDKYYDLVLFEYIPSLNNFYPFRVRDSLKVHYKMVDSFYAPRRGDTKGTIEVYVK